MFEVDGVHDTYTVWLDLNGIWCCTCPWSAYHYKIKCKHIKEVIKRTSYTIEPINDET